MARSENFTAARVAAFTCEPGKSQLIFRDGKTPGLGLRVTAAGTKSYIFETELYGRTIRLTIGDIRTWSIGQAQAEATRLKAMTDQGIDPRDERRAKLRAISEKAAEANAAVTLTLEKLYEAYCKLLEDSGKKDSARIARSLFKNHVPAELKSTPARNVTDERFADALRKVFSSGKQRSSGALRSYLLAAYNTALKARLDTKIPPRFKDFQININPLAAIPAVSGNAGTRVVTDDELRTFIEGLDSRETDHAILLNLLTGGQRMAQLLRATSADWQADTCTLRLFDAKGRRKTPRIHLLPVGPMAAQIISSRIQCAGNRKQLFSLDVQTPGKRVKSVCIAREIKPPFNLRDLRRTVETKLASLKVSKDVRAQVLSHGIGGVQDKHYDMHAYLDEKHAALVTWEKWLTQLNKKKAGALRTKKAKAAPKTDKKVTVRNRVVKS
jgi:hypothetical protein